MTNGDVLCPPPLHLPLPPRGPGVDRLPGAGPLRPRPGHRQHPRGTGDDLLLTCHQRRRTRRKRRRRPCTLHAPSQGPRLRRRHNRPGDPHRPRQQARPDPAGDRPPCHQPGRPRTRLRHRRPHPRHRPLDHHHRDAQTRSSPEASRTLRPPRPVWQRRVGTA